MLDLPLRSRIQDTTYSFKCEACSYVNSMVESMNWLQGELQPAARADCAQGKLKLLKDAFLPESKRATFVTSRSKESRGTWKGKRFGADGYTDGCRHVVTEKLASCWPCTKLFQSGDAERLLWASYVSFAGQPCVDAFGRSELQRKLESVG